MKYQLYAIAILLFVCSCSKSNEIDISRSEPVDTTHIVVYPRFNIEGGASTKLFLYESKISDVNLFIFDSKGKYVKSIYDVSIDKLSLRVDKNQEYYIYALANAGKEYKFLDTNGIENISFEYSRNSLSSDKNILMSGKTTLTKLYDGMELPLTLKRQMSKVILKLDKSRLNEGVRMGIRKIFIKNAPVKVSPFKKNKIEYGDQMVDIPVDAIDIWKKEYTYDYLYENRQGDLETPNGECTYVEMIAVYESPRYSGDLCYRFYLGEGENNYDVKANTLYYINVNFVGNGSVKENNWNVSPVYIADKVFINIPKPDIAITVGMVKVLEWKIVDNDGELPKIKFDKDGIVEVVTISETGVMLRAISRGSTNYTVTIGTRKVVGIITSV